MDNMYTVSATDMRKNWSKNLDIVSRTKPLFIKRTRDDFMLSDIDTMKSLLAVYTFNIRIYKEDDGSYTASLNEIDIVENAETKEDVVKAIKDAIYEYSTDFYSNFQMYSSAPNRKKHIPYVLKALLCNTPQELELNIIA